MKNLTWLALALTYTACAPESPVPGSPSLGQLEQAGLVGPDGPLITCGDDGICNAALCSPGEDPDCVAVDCNADGWCDPTCGEDPDCHLACDARVPLARPDVYPFETVAAVQRDSDGNGTFNARASGAVVGPHMVLTCGHCVYSQKNGGYSPGAIRIGPAMYQDGADTVFPFGTRLAVERRTNSLFAHPDPGNPAGIDYGSLGFVCPFEELTTFMPMVFDVDPAGVLLAGYPTEDLPEPARLRDQWIGAGLREAVLGRQVVYATRSSGGASGAPAMAIVDGAVSIVAVNFATSTGCDGVGARLVQQNEALILRWLAWEPTDAQRRAEGCGVRPPSIPLPEVVHYFETHPEELLSAGELLLGPAGPGQTTPRRRVVQVIENVRYRWEEHPSNPSHPEAGRYLKLLEPEQRVLTPLEARALLTASRRWVGQAASGRFTTRVPLSPEEAVPLPVVAPVDAPVDLSADQPAPVGR